MTKCIALFAVAMVLGGCEGAYRVNDEGHAAPDVSTDTPDDETPTAGDDSPAAGDDSDDTDDDTTSGNAGAPSTPPTNETFCEPNSAHACVCTNGMDGTQPCLNDGWGFGQCACETDDTGSGGAPNTGNDNPSEGGGWSGSTGGTDAGGTYTGSGSNPPIGGSAGSGAVSAATTTYVVTAEAWANFPGWSFTHLSPTLESPDKKDRFYANQSCESPSGSIRKCVLTVDPTLAWEFYAKTGFNGEGSWIPGMDGLTHKCQAYMKVTVTKFDGSSYTDIPFHMVPASDAGCHFRIEPGATLANLDNSNADSDGDGVKNGDEGCSAAKSNPSITSCGQSGGGSNGGSTNANVRTLAFYAFGADYNASPLEMQVFTGGYRTVSCSSVVMTDPQGGNVTANAVRCVVDVDRSQPFEHGIRTGNKWIVGDNGSNGCQAWFRAYVYELSGGTLYPVADFDQSSTNFGQQVTSKYVSKGEGCHLVLPAQ